MKKSFGASAAISVAVMAWLVMFASTASVPAAQQGAQELGHAGRLDLAADDEVVVLARALQVLAHALGPPGPKNAFSQSMGSGKMMVEFFSAAISVSVCR